MNELVQFFDEWELVLPPDAREALRPIAERARAASSGRFEVREGSESGHCCFEATVVDTATPHPVYGTLNPPQFNWVCECFEVEDARRIAAALNAAEGKP